mmetsp:Transcript_10473/g.31994  ORF Transcript_10473/g.31994 Transcript_10473/m.31994 type:complete len:212 (-) Transcript_10473:980-1615(-)
MSTSKVDEKQGETEGLTEEHAPKSIEEVVDWLKDIKKGEYIDVFKKNEIDGDILLTLTSEEMRDDLGIHNLRHRRELLDAINVFVNAKSQVEMLPEHGRILDHLSNVRTFHSWVRVGVQLLAFALISLRLYPVWREQKPIVTSFSLYYSVIGTLAIMYGLVRYFLVSRWIEQSGTKSPKYIPDRAGVVGVLVLVLSASALSLYLIAMEGVN